MPRRLLPTMTPTKALPSRMINRQLLPVYSGSVAAGCRPERRFTLLTYNMLSPYYMWPQVYTYVPEPFKKWEYRHKLLEYELFHKYHADILCLQELTGKDYEKFWRKQMKRRMNFESQYAQKPPPAYWTRAEEEMDGVGTFYNAEKFEHVATDVEYLSDILGALTPSEKEWMAQTQVQLTDAAGRVVGKQSLKKVITQRNQVCLFVTLVHKPTGSLFVVVNTHLYWKYDEVKLAQCFVIMRRLKAIVRRLLTREGASYSKIKVILSGDLNSSQDTLSVRFLRGQVVKVAGLEFQNPMRSFLNGSLYDYIPKEAFDNTCYSGKIKGIFDYMWFHGRDFRLLQVLSGKEVSEELSSTAQPGLPNELHPSDHIPIYAEFEVL
ncbi:AaceriACR277Cp [[Ashbya] aceris (nom. inval.)]|nr:AaceriACR277Cp [[Ashbya] aceris (nom. inval.)]